MSDWEPEKKARVHAFLTELGLPETGRALDFGCGTGVFTAVLRDVLPHWEIVGSDFSRKALELAARAHPAETFLLPDDPMLRSQPFDLLFTHHVIEHVTDLDATLADMSGLLES